MLEQLDRFQTIAEAQPKVAAVEFSPYDRASGGVGFSADPETIARQREIYAELPAVTKPGQPAPFWVFATMREGGLEVDGRTTNWAGFAEHLVRSRPYQDHVAWYPDVPVWILPDEELSPQAVEEEMPTLATRLRGDQPFPEIRIETRPVAAKNGQVRLADGSASRTVPTDQADRPPTLPPALASNAIGQPASLPVIPHVVATFVEELFDDLDSKVPPDPEMWVTGGYAPLGSERSLRTDADELESVYGMSKLDQNRFQLIVNRFGLVLEVRPTNPSAVEWRQRGAVPKPMEIKAKTINKLDGYLGAAPETEGLVGYFRPRTPDWGSVPAELRQAVSARYEQRLSEFADLEPSIRELANAGKIQIADGVVEWGTPEGFKSITGDNDLFRVALPDGRQLDMTEYGQLIWLLIQRKVGVMHPAHVDWQRKNRIDETIFDAIVTRHKSGEPVIRFEPGKEPVLVHAGADFDPASSPSVSPVISRNPRWAETLERKTTLGRMEEPGFGKGWQSSLDSWSRNGLPPEVAGLMPAARTNEWQETSARLGVSKLPARLLADLRTRAGAIFSQHNQTQTVFVEKMSPDELARAGRDEVLKTLVLNRLISDRQLPDREAGAHELARQLARETHNPRQRGNIGARADDHRPLGQSSLPHLSVEITARPPVPSAPVSLSDVLVPGVQVADVRSVVLRDGRGTAIGAAFPSSAEDERVLVDAFRNGAGVPGELSVVMHRGADGKFEVDTNGAPVSLGESEMLKLLQATGFSTGGGWLQSSAISLVTCLLDDPVGHGPVDGLLRQIRSLGYSRAIRPVRGFRIEVRPDGTMRSLGRGQRGAPGSSVLGPDSMGSYSSGSGSDHRSESSTESRSRSSASGWAGTQFPAHSLAAGAVAFSPDRGQLAAWSATYRSLPVDLDEGKPFVVFADVRDGVFDRGAADLAARVQASPSYRQASAARPDLPVAMVVVGADVRGVHAAELAMFADALRGDGPYREVRASGLRPDEIVDGDDFRPVSVPRPGDVRAIALSGPGYPSDSYGLGYATDRRTADAMALMAAAESKFSRRVFIRSKEVGALSQNGGPGAKEVVAPWASATEDGRAAPFALFLTVDADGRYVVARRRGGMLRLDAWQMARLAVAGQVVGGAARDSVRRPLKVTTHTLDPSARFEDPTPEFLEELQSVAGPWPAFSYLGPAEFGEDGTLRVEEAGAFTEHPVFLQDVDLRSRGTAFGFIGGAVTAKKLDDVAAAAARGEFGHPAPAVVVLDGKGSHADVGLNTGPIVELDGSSVGRLLLADPKFRNMVNPRLVVLAAGGAERIDIGGLGFDFAGTLHAAHRFPSVVSPTAGWKLENGRFLLGRGSSLRKVSDLRTGDLQLSTVWGASDGFVAWVARAKDDSTSFSAFQQWFSEMTIESFEEFVGPDGYRAPTPFAQEPPLAIQVLSRDPGGEYRALRSDGMEVRGPAAMIAKVLKDDPTFRGDAGTNRNLPFLVLSLNGDPAGMAEFADVLRKGGYSRTIFVAHGLRMGMPGVLQADGFERIEPASLGPDDVISHPVVTSDGRVRGVFYPSGPFDAITSERSDTRFAEDADDHYFRERVEHDRSGTPVVRQEPRRAPWGRNVFVVDGHGTPGIGTFRLRTGDPYGRGDLILAEANVAANVIVFGGLFRQAAPGKNVVVLHCWGRAASAGRRSLASEMEAAHDRLVRDGRIIRPIRGLIAADKQVAIAPDEPLTVLDGGSFRQVKGDPGGSTRE